MTGTLDEIATYMNNNAGLVLGTNFFIGFMPESPNSCTSIHEYAGGQPLDTYAQSGSDNQTPFAEQPRLQVKVRGEPNDYAVPRATIVAISALLDKVGKRTLSGTIYYSIARQDSPTLVNRDSDDRCVWVVNLSITKAIS